MREPRCRGTNIARVLDLSAEQARELVAAHPKIGHILGTLIAVGTGYTGLGQVAYRTTAREMITVASCDDEPPPPGMIAVVQTFGGDLTWHPPSNRPIPHRASPSS